MSSERPRLNFNNVTRTFQKIFGEEAGANITIELIHAARQYHQGDHESLERFNDNLHIQIEHLIEDPLNRIQIQRILLEQDAPPLLDVTQVHLSDLSDPEILDRAQDIIQLSGLLPPDWEDVLSQRLSEEFSDENLRKLDDEDDDENDLFNPSISR